MKYMICGIRPLPKHNSEIKYNFDSKKGNETIRVNFGDYEDEFNFSEMKPGDSIMKDDDSGVAIETKLPFNPIRDAQRDEEGVLWVKLRQHITVAVEEPPREWRDA